MAPADDVTPPIRRADRLYVGGQWVTPSSRATIDVIDSRPVIAQEEIFGPVLSVIPTADDTDAIRIANDTIYGLHGAVFTTDVERAREVVSQMRTGAIGHNGFKSEFDMGHGGFRQSGIGREGGLDGLLPFLESKAVLLDSPTTRYADAVL
jgi:aldehyde dehydrogenase (NAD+)